MGQLESTFISSALDARCIYCRSEGELTTEHILPLSRGGPDTPDNAIRVCQGCEFDKFDDALGEKCSVYVVILYYNGNL